MGASGATPFGRLFSLVRAESDDTTEGTLVYDMLESADLLGIDELT